MPSRRSSVRNVNPADMFTTDPDQIRAYIASSKEYATFIDADIILEINRQAHRLTSEDDFMEYLCTMKDREYDMMVKFQNVLCKNDRIAKILRKTRRSEEEELYLMNWKSTNYSDYYEANHPNEEYPFDENDYLS